MALTKQAERLFEQWQGSGVITPQQSQALRSQLVGSPLSSPIEAVIGAGIMSEDRCLELVGEALELPVLDLSDPQPEPEALRLLPAPVMRRLGLLPLFIQNSSLTVAVTDPFQPRLVESLRSSAGREVELVLARRKVIAGALDLFVPAAPLAESAERLTHSMMMKAPDLSKWQSLAGDLVTEGREAPVVALVNQLFADAVSQGASDIHLEPEENKCVIRYRVDGVLRHIFDLPKNAQNGLISRIKVMAGLDIAQRLAPQDGKIHLTAGGRELDLRVSSLPMVHGENVVLRLLDPKGLRADLEKLGLAPEMLGQFRRLIHQPYGIILVTGPTGSGKTTTLYSGLSAIASEAINITTIEDPVEYRIPGLRQTQVNAAANLTFATALRAILRQDPDVILVGEVRDRETAQIAVQAAMTGHLVFSTLHTNDSPSAMARLVEMGVAGYLVASTVLGIMAQRLVRRPCGYCSVEGPIAPDALVALGDEGWPGNTTVVHTVGCPQCRHSGYSGRLGIYELLIPNSAVRAAMTAGADTDALRRLALEAGMVSLRQDGLRKAREHRTTVEEVIRVCL